MRNAKMTTALVAIGLVLAPASLRAADPAPDAAAAAKGRLTYVRYCVSCHGPQAKGDGPAEKMNERTLRAYLSKVDETMPETSAFREALGASTASAMGGEA